MKSPAFAVLAAMGLFFAVQASAQETPAKLPIVDDPVYTKPQQLVDVGGGRRLNMYCRGKGSPTVVFDSGLGDSTVAWALVQPAIAKRTRTCSYDRAGLAFSDAANRPGDAQNDASLKDTRCVDAAKNGAIAKDDRPTRNAYWMKPPIRITARRSKTPF